MSSALGRGLRAELTVVAPKDYVAALHARTGSRRHIAKLQELARSKAMTLYPESGSHAYRPSTDSENENLPAARHSVYSAGNAGR